MIKILTDSYQKLEYLTFFIVFFLFAKKTKSKQTKVGTIFLLTHATFESIRAQKETQVKGWQNRESIDWYLRFGIQTKLHL